MWIAECLEFDIFFKTIGMMRMIPQRTLQGMLAMLPYNKHAPVSQKINPTIRKALTITLQTINRCQNNHTAFFTLAVAMALFSLAMMIILWSWKPLAGFFFVMPVIGLEKWLARSGLQQWKHRISAIRPKSVIIRISLIRDETF